MVSVGSKSRPRTPDNTAMDALFLWVLVFGGFWMFRRHDERQRVALLGSYLRKYRIEAHMVQLTDGYLRALGESDPDRAAPIWRNLTATEEALQTELQSLADDLKEVWGERLRVSRWPVSVPMATRLFPRQSFDFRALVALHARGVAATLRNEEGLSTRDRAFRATAELLLFQHSCHWFCRSKNLASARVLAHHRTAYGQLLTAVSPATRTAYDALVSQ